MAKIFLFAKIKEDNKLYEITSKGLIEIKDNSKINSKGSICLIYEEPISNNNVMSKYINVGIHDVLLTDNDIHRENHVKFGSATQTKIFRFNVNKSAYRLSISLKKEVINDLFYKYEFSKIIPLSIFLWQNGEGIHGIVSKQISFFKIVDKNYQTAKNINELANIIYSEEFSGELDKDNLVVLNNIYESNHSKKENTKTNFNIYLLEKVDEEFFEDVNSKEHSFEELKKLIDKTEFFIEDTVSAYYFSKIYKPFLILGIVAFAGITGVAFTFNTKNIAENFFLEKDIAEKKEIIRKQDILIKDLKKENYYPYLQEPELKEKIVQIHEKLKEIIKFNEVSDLKIQIVSPGKVKINFYVDTYEKFENLDNMYKNMNEIKFTQKKDNNKYHFELIYNINELAKKAKDNFQSTNSNKGKK